MIKFSLFFEALDNLKHKQPAKNPVALILGRFQPFTIGHQELLDIVKNKVKNVPIFLFIIKGKKPNPKSPFPGELIKKIVETCVKDKNLHVEIFNSGDIPRIVDYLRSKGYEVKYISYGPDRKEGYVRQVERYKDIMNWDIKTIDTQRNEQKVSGSKVRAAIADDDEETFKKLTPKCEWKFYNELKKYLKMR